MSHKLTVACVLAAISVQPSCGGVEPVAHDGEFEECVSIGSKTLTEFLKSKEILRHSKIEEFYAAALKYDNRFEFRVRESYEPIPTPVCSVCKDLEFDDFRYLILREGETSRELKRFAVYISEGSVRCVESNFGYKNPYQK